MENFEFYNPTKILFGKGVIPSIANEILAKGFKKVALIAGGGSIKNNGVYDQVVEALKNNGVEWVECWGVRPNPTLTTANEILESVKESGAEALLAVGGGSVIDTAKAVAAGFYAGDIWSVYEAGEEVLKALPLFTVLTLSATGTEMDEFSVLSNENELKKWGIFGRALFPIASAIDPQVQTSLPWRQTVNGAVDAISHVMEQYFSGRKALTTMAMCESLIKSLIASTDILQSEPDNYDSRADLAWGASLALNGLARCGTGTGDWSTHYIEHALSALKSEVAHAEGLAVIFPAWIAYVGSDDQEAFSRWANEVWRCDKVIDAVEAYREKLRQWGHPTSLGELGFSREDFTKILEVIRSRGEVGRVRLLNDEDIISILELAL